LASELALLVQLVQALIIKLIRYRDELLVPPIVTGFVSAQKENGCAKRIERIQSPQWSSAALSS
jgi:hypothetical protein